MKTQKILSPTVSSKGFTLIELLVVIAIIAVLAAISVPVTMSVIKRSKRTTALNMIKSMETGVDRYYAEYNYLPNFRTSSPPTWNYWLWTNEGQNIQFLRDLTGESELYNLKGKKFLNLPDAKGKKNGFSRENNGKGKVQYLFDKDGAGFGYIVDYDYDEELPIPSFYQSESGPKTVKGRRIIIWNYGPDRKRGTKDDLTSW